MTGRGGDVLKDSAAYQELMGRLAPNPLAVLYVGERGQQDGVAAAQRLLWPQFGQCRSSMSMAKYTGTHFVSCSMCHV